MSPFFFLAVTALHGSLFMFSLRWQVVDRLALWYLRVLLLALATDNLVVALGAYLLEEPGYAIATRLRYALHALVLPGLCWYALRLLQRARPGAVKRMFIAPVLLLVALACLVYGAYHEIFLLQLQPAQTETFPRLVSVASGLPWATILCNLVLLIAGVFYWRAMAWPWAFLGALVILLVNGAMVGSPYALVAGVLAEVVFVSALLWTEYRYQTAAPLLKTEEKA